jgi:signal transduction histidine kinase
MSPIQEKTIDLLERCIAAADRQPLLPALMDAMRECAGALGAELKSTAPAQVIALSGVTEAAHSMEFTLIASGRRRGTLTLRFAAPSYADLPPGALATLAAILADEANIREMRKLIEGAAHDLRGAFVRLNTLSQLINLENASDPVQEEISGHMKRNLASVDILLRDLYAIVAGPKGTQPVCSILEAYENARWSLKRELQESEAKVEFEGTDCKVRMLEDELADVLRRLIDNAIKFSEQAPAVATISVDDADTNVRIAITDNGPGVDPQYREVIFEPFQRLHGKQYPGHGLGLAICRKKIEAAGGMIWAEPASPSGLSLKILIPRA